MFPAINNWFKMFIIDPNSSEGLRMRARKLEEDAGKPENTQYAENFMLLAEIYREIAAKNWPSWKNKQWIKEHIHDPAKSAKNGGGRAHE